MLNVNFSVKRVKFDSKWLLHYFKSKIEGKDQESIQSSAIPYRDTMREGEINTRKHYTQENQE